MAKFFGFSHKSQNQPSDTQSITPIFTLLKNETLGFLDSCDIAYYYSAIDTAFPFVINRRVTAGYSQGTPRVVRRNECHSGVRHFVTVSKCPDPNVTLFLFDVFLLAVDETIEY